MNPPDKTAQNTGLQIFNAKSLDLRLSSDRKACELILKYFFRETPELLSLLAKSAEEDNEAQFKKAAHKLKGSAANASAETISFTAERLEKCDFLKEKKQIKEVLEDLEKEFLLFSDCVKNEGF